MIRRILVVALLLSTLGVGAVSAQDGVTITWWSEVFSMPSNIQEVLVDAFNEAHPGITLEMVGQEDLNQTLRTAIQAGEAPDLLVTPGASFIAEYVDAGLVEPLDDAAAELGWADKVLDWAYQSGQLGGVLYSIPLTYESLVLFYNKTVFEENGWEAPTTFEEFEAIVAAAQDIGIYPLAYGNATWQPSNEHLMGMYLNAYAGRENVYKALVGEIPWTHESIVGATELLRRHIADDALFSGGLENYFANGGDDWRAEFASGEAAMILSGTWNFRSIGGFFEEAGNEWDWVPIPSMSDMAGEYGYELATGTTVSVNAQSPNKDAAIKALDFLISDPALVLKLAADVGFGEWVVPVHFGVDDFPEGTDERVVRFFSDFAAVTGEGRIGYTTWTFWPAAPNVHLWEAVENVWWGDISVEEYLEEHERLWQIERDAGNLLPVPAPAMGGM
ncbi:MAG: extracellular solute-binding protein [Anaerolineaceae bacterium]|nr:extracellular solute-binding protein [Anaerolineaceae bacterium]MCY4023477.1 extracellular solute-binding protein [Anaerolineaceae bacterium]